MRKSGFTLLELVVVLLILVGLYFIAMVFVLLVGWMFFPGRIAGELRFSPQQIALAFVLLVVTTRIAHGLLKRFYSQLSTDQPQSSPCWQIGWTLLVMATLLLFLSAGLSVVGVAWMIDRIRTSEDSIFLSYREAARRSQSNNNLKQIGIGVHNYHDMFKRFPAGATFNEFGEMQHGWMTALLPYVEHGDLQINWDLPWNHPDQGEAFKTRIPYFLNPSFDATHDAEGYALSHYAANSRVMGGRKPLSFSQIRDGTSNTLLSGEVNHDFKPWGHPVNWRDPAKGINRLGGFGSIRLFRGCQFVFADGSARFISQDIDPNVLRALATPDAGEDVEHWDRY